MMACNSDHRIEALVKKHRAQSSPFLEIGRPIYLFFDHTFKCFDIELQMSREWKEK